MWKSIALCASLFGSAALGMAAFARWIQPGVLPATVAAGLCLIGVVLILAAPTAAEVVDAVVESELPAPRLRTALAHSPTDLKVIDLPKVDATRVTDKLRIV